MPDTTVLGDSDAPIPVCVCRVNLLAGELVQRKVQGADRFSFWSKRQKPPVS